MTTLVGLEFPKRLYNKFSGRKLFYESIENDTANGRVYLRCLLKQKDTYNNSSVLNMTNALFRILLHVWLLVALWAIL